MTPQTPSGQQAVDIEAAWNAALAASQEQRRG